MRDPNNIDLQSVDPDLSIDDQNPTEQSGVDDLQDYASAVQSWGSDIVEGVTGGAPSPATGRFSSPASCTVPLFHQSHRITTPFIVAALLTVLILVIVFIPKP